MLTVISCIRAPGEAGNSSGWISERARLILRRGRLISNIFGANVYANVLKGTFSTDCKSHRIRIGLKRGRCSVMTPSYFTRLCSVGYVRHHTRGIYPGYYPTKNFCKFYRTFISVPGTSVSSVRPCHKYPGYGYSIFIPARNFCEFCTPVPQYPELL